MDIMGKNKHDYISSRGYLEHYERECRLCKRVALIEDMKWYFAMGIVLLIILLLDKYNGGYYEWIEKL